jgi:EmrB/QacA subfamily drug resistance transporter
MSAGDEVAAGARATAPATKNRNQPDHPIAQPWGETLSRRRIILVIASVMLGMLLSALDQTVVGTALPRIIADLNGLQHYAWVATGYLLASTASMPIWGKLSDAYGRKLFFIIGMVIFVVGSALSGQAHTMNELIIFRTFQGLGAGAMMPIVQAILGDIFPPVQRARWMGYLMSIFGVATIIGPLLGGWITDSVGWRWTFYVNVPIGIAALAFALYALPGHASLRRHDIDYFGASLLIAASVPLLLAFSWAGSTYSWGSTTIVGLFVFSVVMGLLFVWREMRAAEPVINPQLFRNSIFAISAVAGALQFAGLYGAIMYLPLFVQGVMGKSATNSGVVLTPLMLGAIVTSIGAGQLMARTGRYKALVVAGFVAAAGGMYLLSRMGVATTQVTLVLYMVVLGLGMGVAMSAFTVIVQNQYPTHRLGEVTASLQFFRSIGATIGLAVFGSVLNSRFASHLAHSLPAQLQALDHGATAAQLNNPQVLLAPGAQDKIAASFTKFGAQGHGLFVAFMSAVRHSLASGISGLFLIGAIISVAGLAVVIFLKEVPLRRTLAMEDDDDAGAASSSATAAPAATATLMADRIGEQAEPS